MFAMHYTDAVLDVPLTHVKEMNSELSYKTVPAGAFKDQVCSLDVWTYAFGEHLSSIVACTVVLQRITHLRKSTHPSHLIGSISFTK